MLQVWAGSNFEGGFIDVKKLQSCLLCLFVKFVEFVVFLCLFVEVVYHQVCSVANKELRRHVLAHFYNTFDPLMQKVLWPNEHS